MASFTMAFVDLSFHLDPENALLISNILLTHKRNAAVILRVEHICHTLAEDYDSGYSHESRWRVL